MSFSGLKDLVKSVWKDPTQRVLSLGAIAAVAIVSVAGIGLIATHKTVTIKVDGNSYQVSTWQRLPLAAIQEAGVQVRTADKVVSPAAALSDSDTIELVRAKSFGIVSPGSERRTWVAANSTVEAATSLADKSKVEVAVAANRVEANQPQSALALADKATAATLNVDGKSQEITLEPGLSPAQELAKQGIELSPLDRVNVSVDEGGKVAVNVVRVKREVTEDKDVTEKPVEEIKDDSLYEGQREVVEAGSDEVVVTRTFKIYEDGKVVHEQVLSVEKTSELKKEVVKVGTKPRPTYSGTYLTDDEMWNKIIMCESGGNPRAVNPAGYYGLYQFSLPTWRSVGGTGNPIDASPEEQTMRAKILQQRSGWGQWSCAR